MKLRTKIAALLFALTVVITVFALSGYQAADNYTVDFYCYMEEEDIRFYLLPDEKISSIYIGSTNGSALTSAGRIFTWGTNEYGQLGNGTNAVPSSRIPMDVTGSFALNDGETIISMGLGTYHAGVLTSNGRVFMWGRNDFGQIGDPALTPGSTAMQLIPLDITSQFGLAADESVTNLVLGAFNSAAITSAGRAFVWGYNAQGQVGDGTTSSGKPAPVDITGNFFLTQGETVASIELGINHSGAITSNGRVFTWGYNYYGQLGNGTSGVGATVLLPADITSMFALVGQKVIRLSLGSSHSTAVTSNNRIFAWGTNDSGQIGNPNLAVGTSQLKPLDVTQYLNLAVGENVVRISSGNKYTRALTSNHRVFTWGSNSTGQIGDPTLAPGPGVTQRTPDDITQYFDLHESETIDTCAIGNGNGSHYGVITSENRVFMWGYGASGQLGTGVLNPAYSSPVLLPIQKVVYLGSKQYVAGDTITPPDNQIDWTLDPNTVLTWDFGSNLMPDRNLILFGNGIFYTVSYDTFGGNNVVSESVYENSTITKPADPIRIGYTFLGWYTSSNGGNDLDTLWDFDSNIMISDITLYAKWQSQERTITYYTYVAEAGVGFYLLPGETIVSLSTSIGNSAALTSTGRVFTWGWNLIGQLGDGTNGAGTDKYIPVDITNSFLLNEGEKIVYIGYGTANAGALTSEGRVFTWGYNTYGELGDGTSGAGTDKYLPEDVTWNFALNANEKITSLTISDFACGAITSDNRLFMWGYNFYGQLGTGTAGVTDSNRSTPEDITGNFSLNPGETIMKLVLGSNHSGVITSEGRAFTWGYNAQGQLGNGATEHLYLPTNITPYFLLYSGETIKNMSFGDLHSGAITSNGRVFTWGYNAQGQLGGGESGAGTDKTTPEDITANFSLNSGETVTYISFGNEFSRAMTSDGRVFTWGYNPYGQLGDGTSGAGTEKSSPTDITNNFELNPDEKIIVFAIGNNTAHTGIITSDNRIFMWGYNENGQLGNGAVESKSIPITLISREVTFYGSQTYYVGDPLTSIKSKIIWHTDPNIYFVSGTEFNFNTLMPPHSFILFGPPITELTISYDSQGGNTVADATIAVDTLVTKPDDPQKIGYIFDGWWVSSDGGITLSEEWDFSVDIPNDDITLYAKWNGTLKTVTYYTYVEEAGVSFYLLPGETITSFISGVGNGGAITSTGRVFIWGYNFYGALGNGTSGNGTDEYLPIDITHNFLLNEDETIINLSLGLLHCGVLTSAGRVFMWGNNSYGQLGNGTSDINVSQNFPLDITGNFQLNASEKITSLSLGSYHSGVMTSDNRIFMWGQNAYGQIGDGEVGIVNNALIPKDITGNFSLNTGEKFKELSLGTYFSGVVTSDSHLFMWGRNNTGQIGNNTSGATNQVLPLDITAFIALNPSETIVNLAFGEGFGGIVTSDGRLFMWGANSYGQIGNPDLQTSQNQLIPLDITEYVALVSGEKIILLSAGNQSAGLLTSDGRVFTWGSNWYGQIGDPGLPTGINDPQPSPLDITGNFSFANGNEKIILLTGHNSNGFGAMTSDNNLFMWGWNMYGQFADGTQTDQNIPTGIRTKFTTYFGSQTYIVGEEMTSINDSVIWNTDPNIYSADGTFWDFTNNTMPPYNFILFGNAVSFTVSYNSRGGNSIGSENILADEKATGPIDPNRFGYKFDGWYTSDDNGVTLASRWDFDTNTVTSDIILYAKWLLVKPVISLSADDTEVEYGDTITISADASNDASVTYSYDWYKDDVFLKTTDVNTLVLDNVSESGTYYVIITATDGDNVSASETTNSVTVTITARNLTVTIDDQTKIYGESDPLFTYEITLGSKLDNDAFNGALTRTSGENVGTYNITGGTLSAGSNYNITFENGELEIEAEELTLSWTNTTLVYSGEIQKPNGTLTGIIAGDTVNLSIISDRESINAGSYAATASIDNDNYYIKSGDETKSFIITAMEVVLVWSNTTLVYNGETQKPAATYTNVSGETVNAVISGEETDAGTYTATASTASNYTFSNSTQGFEITSKELSITWGSLSFTYNRLVQIPSGNLTGIIDGDTVNLSIISDRESIDTGSYTADASIDNDNYYIKSGDETKTFSIVAKELSITWGTLSFTYNGLSQVPTGSLVGVIDGDIVNLSIVSDRESINTGSYTATGSIDDTNYYIKSGDETKDFSIATKEVALTWSNTELTYSGVTQKPTASYTDVSGETVSATISGGQGETGTYTATAAANDNYTFTNATQGFVINAKELSITWGTLSFTYSGLSQMPTGTLVGVIDGDTLTLSIVADRESINTGNYNASASIDNDNYYIKSGDETQNFSITAKEVELSWSNLSMAYNGTAQKPTASYTNVLGETVNAVVTGEETDAGTYTSDVSAVSNYVFSNSTQGFEITAKELTVIWTNTVLTYTGEIQKPAGNLTGVIDGDTVNLSITADRESISTGSYTATASIDNSNYYIKSGDETKAFTIVETGTVLTWSNSSLTYNGEIQIPSATYVNSSGETVSAMINGGQRDAGTYTATAAEVSNYTFTNATQEFEITAKELSITWGTLSFTYNGLVQIPTGNLTGVIDGDTVNLSITADRESVNAGSYTVGASIDNDNYYIKSGDESNNFSITELEVLLVWDNFDLVYNRESQKPAASYTDISGEKVSASVNGVQTNVGTYEASTDPVVNYIFSNGTQKFEITAKELSITWGTLSFTYNGLVQIPTGNLTGIIDGDNVTLNIETDRESIDTGSYKADASIDTGNYYIKSGDETKGFNITAKELELSWSNLSLIYNGEIRQPKATYQNVFGETVLAIVNSGEINVGTYKASVSAVTNYTFSNGTQGFDITSKELGVTWGTLSFMYNGLSQIPIGNLAGVIDGDTVNLSITADRESINTGSYTADASIDNTNYYIKSGDETKGFNITAKEVELSWSNLSLVYNRESQKPVASYTDISGETVNAVVSGEETNVGTYKANATASDNYIFSNGTQEFVIAVRELSITWGTLSFTYNGLSQIPTGNLTGIIDGDTVNLSIESDRESINTGDYNASATIDNSNYYIKSGDEEKEFIITAIILEVTVDDKTKVYGDADPEFTYSITSGSLITGDSFAGGPARDGGEDCGNYAITSGSLNVGDNYDVTFSEGSLEITKKEIIVHVDDIKITANDTIDYCCTIAPGQFCFDDDESCLGFINGDSLTYNIDEHDIATPGTYPISVVDGYTAVNYSFTYLSGELTVLAASVAAVDYITESVYSGSAVVLNPKYYSDSDKTNEITDLENVVITITLNDVTVTEIKNAGVYKITITWDDVTYGTGSDEKDYTVTKVILNFALDPKEYIFNGTEYEVTPSITNLVSGESVDFDIANNKYTNVGAYTLEITGISGTDSANYELPVTKEIGFSIIPVALVVTIDNKEKVYGGADPELTFALTEGSLIGSDALSGTVSRNSGENAGTYDITGGTITAGSNYNITFKKGIFTITKANAVVSEKPVLSDIFDGQKVSASSVSGGVITGLEGDILSGTYSFVNPDETRSFGEYTDIKMKFSDTDGNYNDIVMDVALNILEIEVSFNTEGGSTINSIDVKYGSLLRDIPTPAKDNYVFGGWYKDEGLTEEWDIENDVVTHGMTLYAKWNTAESTNYWWLWMMGSIALTLAVFIIVLLLDKKRREDKERKAN